MQSIKKISQSTSTLQASSSENLKVLIRIRPPLAREIEEGLPFRSIAIVPKKQINPEIPQVLAIFEYLGCEYEESERQREWVECPQYFEEHRYTFDRIFDMKSTQAEVYDAAGLPAIQSILEGYNATILAYGQTGTGKTYTMEGFTYNYTDEQRGIVPRAIEHIFNFIETNENKNTTFIIRATYLQIYNECISDLLRPENQNLQIRESKKRGLYVQELSEWAVRGPNDIYALLKRGASCRAKACTNMNDLSSRSHAVFTIQVEQMTQGDKMGKSIKIGKLNLVDLAGSERIKVTGAQGKQLEESKNINKSLSALGNVIYALTDPKGRTHIPYRDSKLTRLLENSLGGNCKTTMIAMISPAQCSFNETLSTLNFAKRAKTLKSKAYINEDIDHNALIRKYEEELKKLRMELEEKNKMLTSNKYIMELKEEKDKMERDKNEVINALHEASESYLRERDEKQKLEEKIQRMNFQLIQGGEKIKIEEMPEFQTLLKKHQILFEKNFTEEKQKEIKLVNNQQIDIMNSLTIKLNERDEKIAQLEEKNESLEEIIKDKDNQMASLMKKLEDYETLLQQNGKIYNSKGDKAENINSKTIPKNEGNEDIKNTSEDKIRNNFEDKIKELNYVISEKNKEIAQYKQKLSEYQNIHGDNILSAKKNTNGKGIQPTRNNTLNLNNTAGKINPKEIRIGLNKDNTSKITGITITDSVNSMENQRLNKTYAPQSENSIKNIIIENIKKDS
ncbi:MAG: hypothetical protein MJ252_16805 [archaeon]|nr:hypothetical protein [archaeon]